MKAKIQLCSCGGIVELATVLLKCSKLTEVGSMSQSYLFDIVLVSNDVYGWQGDLLLVDVREVAVSD